MLLRHLKRALMILDTFINLDSVQCFVRMKGNFLWNKLDTLEYEIIY